MKNLLDRFSAAVPGAVASSNNSFAALVTAYMSEKRGSEESRIEGA